jgi:hypothetical protein
VPRRVRPPREGSVWRTGPDARLESIRSLRELTVCQQTLAEFRCRCLLLAPGFDSQGFDLLTGLF